MTRNGIARRKAPNKRRPGVRRGRVKDLPYMAWMRRQPCLITGICSGDYEWVRITTHHVRECGSSKNDRRTIRLSSQYHMEAFGPHSIEKLGKRKFEEFHGIDIETAILDYNNRYDQEARC